MTKSAEAVFLRNLRNANCRRISVPQDTVHLLQPAEATVSARAHIQLLLAGRAQQALGHTDSHTDVSYEEGRLGTQEIFEPDQDLSMVARGPSFFVVPPL